jgi:hypothetical protein
VALERQDFDSPLPDAPVWDPGEATRSEEAVIVTNDWDELRRFMWNYVGIVRSDERLVRASRRIALLKEEIREYYFRHLVTGDLLELRNIADIAELIITRRRVPTGEPRPSLQRRPSGLGRYLPCGHRPARGCASRACARCLAHRSQPSLGKPLTRPARLAAAHMWRP